MRVAFTTLGCKVNQSETDQLARQFEEAGYARVPFDTVADVYVVNTCTVTHVADKKSRQTIGQAHRVNPEALVVATGCYASIVGEGLAKEKTMVVRNRDKDRLLMLVEGRLGQSLPETPHFVDTEKYHDVVTNRDRARAMVKAQDGCDSHCTYCIIPRARGRSRSMPPERITQRVRALVQAGHAEIVLTGVDLGSYGEDDPALSDLGGLLRRILDETEVGRIRVSSLEPGDFDERWLELWADSRLCRHLHVPLQAGSAGVLERMERKYTPGAFAAMVDACRRVVPGITITTDVIAGFPGETDEEYLEGYSFIRKIGFDGMHVFKYSSRSGTRAARFTDQVPEDVKNERARQLREEAARGVKGLLERHVGEIARVAWEDRVDDLGRGITDTNVRVYGVVKDGMRVGLPRVRLTGSFRDGLWADPVGASLALVPNGQAKR